ncbi:MAG: helix-turn-helix domain-containing protein, partial [Alphaproteobacteria bacterium]|nr:helix-turn-helix domain-containing protein [Alphaproteobacteria bacterium]
AVVPPAVEVSKQQTGQRYGDYFQEDGNIKTMQNIEEEVIKLAISHYKGSLSEVARRLKIGRSTLYRKIESWENDKL